jgi:hypothetical protein
MLSPLLFLGGVGFPELLILLVMFGIPLALSVTAVILMVTSKVDSTTKVLWLLIIVFFPLLGPILYLTIGRRQKPFNPSQS